MNRQAIEAHLSDAGRTCKSGADALHDWTLRQRTPAGGRYGRYYVRVACSRPGCHMYTEFDGVDVATLERLGVEVPEVGM